MTSRSLENLKILVQEVANKAKNHILSNLNNISILSSEGRDIKINLDKEANDLIKNDLLENSPYSVLTEESGHHENSKRSQQDEG